jgi:hypothetical protein
MHRVRAGRLAPRALIECDIEYYLIARAKALGGEVRKVRWVGRNGAPDRLVMLPHRAAIWIEVKAPGEKAKPHQAREHARMRCLGQRVEIVDSFDQVDEVLR